MEIIDQEKVEEEPGDLIEKSWFFGNFFDRKTRMSRCYSDPCSSSSSSNSLITTDEEILVGKSYEETYSSLKKLPQGDNLGSPVVLIRTPSLPEESTLQGKGSSKSRLHRASNNNNLYRAPSLPTSLSREEIQDEEESDFSMSKLIRQASLKRSDMLPPRRLPKGRLTQSSSTPKQLPRQKLDLESIKTESPEGGKMIRRQQSLNRTKLYKSSSNLVDELQGFKDLSIKYDYQKDLSPGLQEKKTHLSDHQAWQPAENSSSPIGEKRSVDDMKAQIKFWARAVASNVRQEC
ncbi:hypothetical protein ACH5RR_028114 [Cinchona calisaya]|uniref:Uncharacterized protein n=1 Tax=Cinchona calisaya TaxID=153742 RepID=A0ABD2YT57_9GENT